MPLQQAPTPGAHAGADTWRQCFFFCLYLAISPDSGYRQILTKLGLTGKAVAAVRSANHTGYGGQRQTPPVASSSRGLTWAIANF